MNNEKNNMGECKQVKINDYIKNEVVHKSDGIEKIAKVTLKNISNHKYNSISKEIHKVPKYGITDIKSTSYYQKI